MASINAQGKNKEPVWEDKGIGDIAALQKFVEKHSAKTVGETQIVQLFKNIFHLLEANGICFSSGALVFQNDTNVLFNILTFNKLRIPDDTYTCNDPRSVKNKNKNKNLDIFATSTHLNVYKNTSISPGDCVPEVHHAADVRKILKTYGPNQTKYEIVFTTPVQNLCGECSDSPKTGETSETKRNCLYYPFKYVHKKGTKDFPFLFVKFESHPTKTANHVMELVTKTARKHVNQALNKTAKNPILGFDYDKRYPPRREDDKKCAYHEKYYNLDLEFYKIYSSNLAQDLEMFEWYNDTIRTGCEFFVTNNLLILFLTQYLATKPTCAALKQNMQFKKQAREGVVKKVTKKKKTPVVKGPVSKAAIPTQKKPTSLPLKKPTSLPLKQKYMSLPVNKASMPTNKASMPTNKAKSMPVQEQK